VNWTGRKVLVTGAEGFIGSHLTERLAALGALVRAHVLYNSFNRLGWIDEFDPAVRDRLDVFLGDVTNPYRTAETVAGCEVVFHLAALIGIPYSYHAPEAYVQTNVAGTLNVLQACRAAGVAKVVHTSTSEVYGSAQRVPIDEAHPLVGQSPYSASKIGADMIAQSFAMSFKLPVVICRPFNTYGPRQSDRAVIPTIITQLLGGAKELKLGTLTTRRDFTYVSDTVEGFLAVAAAPDAAGEVFNLGTGRDVAIGELAEKIGGIIGRNVPVVCDRRRVRPDASEVQRLCADNTRARQRAGWQPTIELDDGLRRTVEFFRTRPQAPSKDYAI